MAEIIRTKTHDNNLAKLASFLDTVDPDKFEMEYFLIGKEGDYMGLEERKKVHNCGTAACAIGWAPTAGIRVSKNDETWNDYSVRVFGYADGSDVWEYMFGGEWTSYDNTPGGAAKRIRYVLENGHAPARWDEHRQGFEDLEDEEDGDEALSFAVE